MNYETNLLILMRHLILFFFFLLKSFIHRQIVERHTLVSSLANSCFIRFIFTNVEKLCPHKYDVGSFYFILIIVFLENFSKMQDSFIFEIILWHSRLEFMPSCPREVSLCTTHTHKTNT